MTEQVVYVYRVLDKYTPILNKINSATRKFKSTIKGAQESAGNLGKKMSSLQSIAAGFAAATGGKAALDKYVGFAASMNKLESVTFASADQMKRMRDMAKNLGATTAFTAGEAAQGMTYLAMAGLSVDEVLQAIPKSLQLAAAGGISLAEAADISTNVLGQMKLSVEDLSHVNDVLALAQSKANFNITELFESMRPVATTANNLGMSLEELSANLGAMAQQGEKGSIAGTLLRNALTEIAGAGKKQIKIYKRLGINLKDFIDESGKIKNFSGLMDKLRALQEQGKLTIPVLQALYGDRGFRAVQIIVGTAADKIKEFENAVTKSTGASKKAADIQMKGLPGVMASIASAFEAVNIAIFESGLDVILIQLGQDVANLAREFSSINPAILKTIGVIAAISAVVAPAVVAFGFMFTVIGAISAPLVVVGAAIVAVGSALYQVRDNWKYLVADFKLGLEWATEKFNAFKDIVLGLKNSLVGGISGFISGEKEKKGIFEGIKNIFGFGEKGVAAKNSIVSKHSLNGNITVAAEKGSSVNRAYMKTSVPGNLGFNIAAGVAQ